MATKTAAKKPTEPQDLHEVLARCAETNAPLPLGVYFGLNEELYHADEGLGSGDIRRLLRGTAAFYHEAKFNPQRPPSKSTPAQIAGKAVHRIVLEGMAPFKADFVRRPDDPEDATPTEKGATTKAAKKDLREGQDLLHGDVYDRCLMVGGEIASNPDLATAFQNGMPEVAIFWEEPGEPEGPPVRCKALIDYLKIRGDGDLKTIANGLDLEFDLAVRRAIRYSRMTVQAALYRRGRAKLPDYLATGQVFGAVDMEWLAKVAANPMEKVGWQWVFYQREDAPEVASYQLTPTNPLLKSANEAVDEALMRFQRAMLEFGRDKTWRNHTPVKELHEEDLAYTAGAY